MNLQLHITTDGPGNWRQARLLIIVERGSPLPDYSFLLPSEPNSSLMPPMEPSKLVAS